MHEQVFAQRIIEILNTKIDKAKKIRRVQVNILLSPFSHVSASSLEEAFSLLGRGDPLIERARLNIELSKVELFCRGCGRIHLLQKPSVVCPDCRGNDVEVNYPAQEFLITSLELEEE